jgi:hypothetical protein
MLLSAGTYHAKVSGVSFEVIGEANYPVLKVSFKPHHFRNGSVFVEFDGNETDKMYFLSTDIAVKGAQAGRSKLEILRDELKSTFEYAGPLNEEAIKTILGKELEIVVELNPKGYPQVKWVNQVGKKRAGAVKALPPDILAKLSAAYAGEPVASATASPKDFFSQFKGKADG